MFLGVSRSIMQKKMLLLDSEPVIPNNCRRTDLRILKSLRKDYKWPKIKSYHLKTVMLLEVELYDSTYWASENMMSFFKASIGTTQRFS